MKAQMQAGTSFNISGRSEIAKKQMAVTGKKRRSMAWFTRCVREKPAMIIIPKPPARRPIVTTASVVYMPKRVMQ